MSLPDPKAKRSTKKKIDIPYNRWPNRLRRAVKSFIKIFIVVSILTTIYLLATIDDVSLGVFLTTAATILQLGLTLIFVIFQLVLTYGLLLWFLGRPKLEVIRPGDDTTVTFDDYWGQPQLVKLVKQWMSLLRDRKEFEKMGGKYISGLLLYGPPGTGKTMLAKAIAGESGMAFVAAEGTGFQGTFVGTDVIKVLQFAGKARGLARKYGACVAYIDEIDAIGTNRGGVRGDQGMGMGMRGGMFGVGMFGLSTLLSQMDGMNNLSRGEKFTRSIYKLFGRQYKPKRNWHVMWMGSTNRPEVLDPALTRSGRLDTKIAVDPPDRASRRMIIQGYLNRIQHDDTVDVEAIVADTNGLTPADINGAITKDAVRIAFFDGRKKVGQKDIDKAFMEQQIGMEMPIEEMEEQQRRVLAYHEAGHAVAQYYVMPDQKIVRATIVRLSTGSKGHVMPVDTVEQHIEPVMRYAYDIIVALAGRGAEKIYSGEIYNSVGGDYRMVQRNLWLLAVTGFFGPRMALSADSAEGIFKDKTMEQYWLQMEDATEKLLRRHWREVTALAEELLVRTTLNGKEVVDIIEANQSADTIDENIIPKTLAAIRAQALAEIRNGKSGGQLLHEPIPLNGELTAKISQGNNGSAVNTSAGETIVIINGNGNGTNSGSGSYQPTPNPGNAGNAPSSEGPTLVGGGMSDFQPPVVNGGSDNPPPEQQK
jgi:cell division protease FtsH